jgi:biotin carboxyl carrier protein
MEIKSRMPGKVDAVNVKVGDAVRRGDVLLVLEAMKMNTPVPTPEDGTVRELKVEPGARVNAGAVLVVLD